jgi:hypothetical protein
MSIFAKKILVGYQAVKASGASALALNNIPMGAPEIGSAEKVASSSSVKSDLGVKSLPLTYISSSDS